MLRKLSALLLALLLLFLSVSCDATTISQKGNDITTTPAAGTVLSPNVPEYNLISITYKAPGVYDYVNSNQTDAQATALWQELTRLLSESTYTTAEADWGEEEKKDYYFISYLPKGGAITQTVFSFAAGGNCEINLKVCTTEDGVAYETVAQYFAQLKEMISVPEETAKSRAK